MPQKAKILLMGMVNVVTENPCQARQRDRVRINELSKDYHCFTLSCQDVHDGAPNHIVGNWNSSRTMSDLEMLVRTSKMPSRGRRHTIPTISETAVTAFDLIIWDYMWMQTGYAMFNDDFITKVVVPFATRDIIVSGGCIIIPWTSNLKHIFDNHRDQIFDRLYDVSYISDDLLHAHPLWSATERVGSEAIQTLGKVLSRQVSAHTLNGKFIVFTRR
jgi:hypothetical protein